MSKKQGLRCAKPGCNNPARWNVFFAGCPLYGSACDDHAAELLKHGKGGWPVACLKVVSRTFLDDDDPVNVKEAEAAARVARAGLECKCQPTWPPYAMVAHD